MAQLAVEKAGLDVLQLAQRSVGLQGFLRQPAPDRALTTAAVEILAAAGLAGDLFTPGGIL